MIALMILVLGWSVFASGYVMVRTGRHDYWGVPGAKMRAGAALMSVGFIAGLVGLLSSAAEAVLLR